MSLEVGMPFEATWKKIVEASSEADIPDIPLEPGTLYRVRARLRSLIDPEPAKALYYALQRIKEEYPYININYVKIYKDGDEYVVEYQVFDDPGIFVKLIVLFIVATIFGIVLIVLIEKAEEAAEKLLPRKEVLNWVWIGVGVALIGFGVGTILGTLRKKER